MSERYEPYRETGGWTPDQGTARHEPDDWREQTTPGMAAVPPLPPAAHPSVGGRGYPAQNNPGQGYGAPSYRNQGYGNAGYGNAGYGNQNYANPDYGTAGAGSVTAPDYAGRPVAFRRPDGLAGLLLVLAGVAAGVSLLLRWVEGSSVTGLNLMRSAWHQLRSSWSIFVDSGLWQPVAAVAGGVILFVLGLLMFVPARTHRALGVLALLVSLGAGAGILVAISGAGWHVGRFQIGFWLAAAVPVLGLIGSLKALFTGPRTAARSPQF